MERKNRIIIGKIEKIFKLEGEVKILPLTYSKNRFKEVKRVYLDEEEDIFLSISSVKIKENGVIVKFKEINNVNDARRFLNFYIYIDRENVKKLDNDSVYFFDLKNYNVVYKEMLLGKVKEIYEDGTGCFVTFDYKEKEYIIPFNKDFVVDIDKKQKILKINHFENMVGHVDVNN